jgi:hypothetical protein
MVFNLSIAHDLVSTQVDFRNAFVQSSLPKPIYVELPKGMKPVGGPKVLKVYKSLYGDRRAPQLWFKHLAAGLAAQGFAPSPNDPCLFIRGDAMVVVYVDDLIVVSKSQKINDEVIARFESDGYDLDSERGDLAGFLGIKIENEKDKSG